MPISFPPSKNPRIVIVGGGFGGINAIRKLKNEDVQVVVIDRNNYHTFQPLLYQVATSGLEVGSIAYPLRKFLGRGRNLFFRMTEMTEVQPEKNRIKTLSGYIDYDYLIIATGTKTNYFGMQDVKDNAMPMKAVDHSIDLRNLILQNFEKIMLTDNPESRQRLLNYVIAGGGPTGVEIAGALSELRRKILPKDYPDFDFSSMRIILVDFAPQLLSAFSEEASAAALKYLKEFGVEVQLGVGVKGFNGRMVSLNNEQSIPSETLIWAAGVTGEVPNGISKELIAKGGRINVDEYCRMQGHENIFIIGDLANHVTEKFPNGLPGLAPVAIQQGKYVAKTIRKIIKKEKIDKFKYVDKGSLATIGRRRAVADLPKNIKFQGVFAWYVWLVVHLFFLVGFRNKVSVLTDWIWNYITWDRRVRLIIKPFKGKENG